MIREYISKAMTGAQYETLSDDGSWYGEIPGFQGVWANCDTLEECRTELEEVSPTTCLRIGCCSASPST